MKKLLSLHVLCLLATLSAIQIAQAEDDPKAAFAKADAALNAVWSKVKTALSESEFNKLKENQRAWIEYREGMARDPRLSGIFSRDELASTSQEYLEMAAMLTEQRSRWLQGRIAPAGGGDITGVWMDSYGGHLEIVEDKETETLAFVVSCARGPTSHTGELRGIADWGSSRLGWFKEKPSPDNPDMLARLAFIYRDDNQLEIVGATTSYHHGASAYFDGIYTKVETLSPEKQKEVVRNAKKPAGE